MEGPGMDRYRDNLPSKGKKHKQLALACGGRSELPSSCNLLPVFHFIFSPICLGGEDTFLIICRRGYCVGFCGYGEDSIHNDNIELQGKYTLTSEK